MSTIFSPSDLLPLKTHVSGIVISLSDHDFIRKFYGKLVIINIALSINSFIFSLLAKIEHVIMYLFH